MHAQFVVIPPLAKVAALFASTTGRSLHTDVEWSVWKDISAAAFEAFRPYIRPSHQKILNSLVAGAEKTPCAFLRQLLRPHELKLQKTSTGWAVRQAKPEEGVAGVRIGPGKVVDWESA
jgi:hypothetical protein